jgi:hypothetical protein
MKVMKGGIAPAPFAPKDIFGLIQYLVQQKVL